MKRNLLFSIIVVLAVGSTSYGQQKNAAISFKEMVFDFGVIKEQDGIVTYNFEFVNSGKGPLIINRVIASCDCTTTEWTKEPLVPGAGGSLKVAFNPKDKLGRIDKTITVFSNAENPTVVLQIKGVVQEKPKTLEEIYNRILGDFRFKGTNLSFGRVFVDKIKTDTIEFICMANEPTKIGCKISGLPYLSVNFVPETLKPKEKGFMIVALDAKKRNDWGLVIDRFHLTQNDKDIDGGLITVSADIEENFSILTEEQRTNAPKMEVADPNYDFGEVEEKQLVQKEFAFTNTGKSDLIIRKIKASCGCTMVEPADKVIKPGQTSIFKASIKTEGFSGRIAKTITIITNDPISPTVAVRMTGTVNHPKK